MNLISIACNNPDNGHFVGRFSALHYGNDQDLELQHVDWYGGVRMTYLDDRKVRISRRIFSYQREKEWFGNWCWNAFWMEPREARRLLRYLRDSGRWHAEAGPCRLYDWFNRQRLTVTCHGDKLPTHEHDAPECPRTPALPREDVSGAGQDSERAGIAAGVDHSD